MRSSRSRGLRPELAGERPRTELVVRVESEVAWGPGQTVQSVVLTVRRGDVSGPLRDRRATALGAGTGRMGLPLSVGVLAGDDTDTPVWIEALGCGNPNDCTPASAVVAQRAVVRFARGQTLELTLLLASACVGVTCASDERCGTGGLCEPATRAQSMVAPLGADDGAVVDVVHTDAGSRTDTRAPDASIADALTLDGTPGTDVPTGSDVDLGTDDGTASTGLALRASGIVTIGPAGTSTGTLRLTETGFESGDRTCVGSLCLVGGIVP